MRDGDRGAAPDPTLRAFESPEAHEGIAAMIRRRSTNPGDVHETVLRGLDLSFAREVLDLGCGFGLFSEKVAPRVAPGARLTGVDACAANEAPFLERVARAGRRARFEAMHIGSTLPWRGGAFDLVLSSYSLYFFPEVLPELARVLAFEGWAIVLTHSRRSFDGLLTAAGLDPSTNPLTALVDRFPAETAAERLGVLFETVERIHFPNTLRFAKADLDDVLVYLQFKLPLLGLDADPSAGEAPPEPMRRAIERWLAEHGGLTEDKTDAGFRCRGPRR